MGNFPTADKMYKTSAYKKSLIEFRQFNKCKKDIKYMSTRGKTSVVCNKLSDEYIQFFTTHGYKVENDIVSWSHLK
jgi:hypothetical protein